MIRSFVILLFFALTTAPALLAPAFPARARDQGAQRLQATGLGFPPATVHDRESAFELARRAAVLDARRNLLEKLEAVHLEAATVVKNYQVEEDTVSSRSQGLLREARVDGVTPLEGGGVKVLMSLPLPPGLSPDLLPDDSPDRTPDRTPDPEPDQAPDLTPDLTPDRPVTAPPLPEGTQQ